MLIISSQTPLLVPFLYSLTPLVESPRPWSYNFICYLPAEDYQIYISRLNLSLLSDISNWICNKYFKFISEMNSLFSYLELLYSQPSISFFQLLSLKTIAYSLISLSHTPFWVLQKSCWVQHKTVFIISHISTLPYWPACLEAYNLSSGLSYLFSYYSIVM